MTRIITREVGALNVVRVRGKMDHAAELTLAEGHTYHLFLSHTWATGQDQARFSAQGASQLRAAPAAPGRSRGHAPPVAGRNASGCLGSPRRLATHAP